MYLMAFFMKMHYVANFPQTARCDGRSLPSPHIASRMSAPYASKKSMKMGLKDLKLFPMEQTSVTKGQGRTNTRQDPLAPGTASPRLSPGSVLGAHPATLAPRPVPLAYLPTPGPPLPTPPPT